MDRRRETRIPVELPGSCRIGGKLYSMFYSQISAHGCRVSGLGHGIAVDDCIEISLGPLGPMDATIRWARDGQAGIEFDSPLEAEIVAYFAAIIPKAA